MNGFDENGLTDLLYTASQDAPPSRVDLSAVLGDGRRRRRRRAVVTPLLVAAVVLGLAAAGFAVMDLRPTSLPVTPGSGGPTTPAPTETRAPAAFPLDRQLFALDETLGMEFTGLGLASNRQNLQYGPALGNGITVDVYAAGQGNPWLSDPAYDRVNAPPVDGRPARFLWQPADPAPDGDPAALAGITFQWAPQAWAAVFHRPDGNDEGALLRLAESLRTDLDVPTLFGFTVSQPDGLRLVHVQQLTAPDGGQSQLWFDIGERASGGLRDGEPYVLVSVDYGTPMESEGVPMQPNTTIAGHPAYVREDRQGDTAAYVAYLLDEGRPAVGVSLIGDAAVDRFGAQQAIALALSVEILGPWHDRSQWTENPIR